MRTALMACVLSGTIALNVVLALVAGTAGPRPEFFGDGFDHTTCADAPKGEPCR